LNAQRARIARKVPKGTAPDEPEPMRKKLRRWRKRKRKLFVMDESQPWSQEVKESLLTRGRERR
jgi:hypothetical protein